MLGWVGIFPKVVVVGASSSLLYSRGGFILYGICMRKKETKKRKARVEFQRRRGTVFVLVSLAIGWGIVHDCIRLLKRR